MGSPVKTKFRHELASKQSLDMDPLGIYIITYVLGFEFDIRGARVSF